MKKATIIFAIVAALLTGCTTNKTALDEHRNYVSWIAFCANRGYDLSDNTYTATNEYLDTWCGSVEEEEAFINAGVELY